MWLEASSFSGVLWRRLKKYLRLWSPREILYNSESCIQSLGSPRGEMTMKASEVMTENYCSRKDWQLSGETRVTLGHCQQK